MSGLRKITSFNDIKNLVKTDPIEIKPPTKRRNEQHNQKISHSLKKFNQTDKGEKLREKKSKSMQEFYESPHGQSIRTKLSKVCGRPKPKALPTETREQIVFEYKQGIKISNLAKKYEVSRASIYRYIKEFS